MRSPPVCSPRRADGSAAGDCSSTRTVNRNLITRSPIRTQHKYRVRPDVNLAPEKLAPGKPHTIKFDFKYNGNGQDAGLGGTGTLSVDGEEVAKGPIEHTVPTRFSLDETFDIGMDTGTPVVEDYADKMPFKFTGTLKKVVIELGKSGLTANAEKKLKEQAEKLARAVE